MVQGQLTLESEYPNISNSLHRQFWRKNMNSDLLKILEESKRRESLLSALVSFFITKYGKDNSFFVTVNDLNKLEGGLLESKSKENGFIITYTHPEMVITAEDKALLKEIKEGHKMVVPRQ
jgi:hypothetical protein